MVMTDWDDTMWLVSESVSLSCYCADHAQFSLTLVCH